MDTVAGREVSIVLSSHLVSDIERVCDYLIVLVDSRVRVAGEIEELVGRPPPAGRRSQPGRCRAGEPGGDRRERSPTASECSSCAATDRSSSPAGRSSRSASRTSCSPTWGTGAIRQGPLDDAGGAVTWLAWRQLRAPAASPWRSRWSRSSSCSGVSGPSSSTSTTPSSSAAARTTTAARYGAHFQALGHLRTRTRPCSSPPRSWWGLLGRAARRARARGGDLPARLDPERDADSAGSWCASRWSCRGRRGHGTAQHRGDVVAAPARPVQRGASATSRRATWCPSPTPCSASRSARCSARSCADARGDGRARSWASSACATWSRSTSGRTSWRR